LKFASLFVLFLQLPLLAEGSKNPRGKNVNKQLAAWPQYLAPFGARKHPGPGLSFPQKAIP